MASLKRAIRNYFLKRWRVDDGALFGRRIYSQEGEDIVLWRMLNPLSLPPGRYVDVGCNHPYHMSNTAMFYTQGWSGVAIDPNPDYAAEFAKYRPRDTFINCGVSDREETLTYHRFKEPLYNTFDPEAAKAVDPTSAPLVKTTEVAVQRLEKILSQVWPDGQSLRLLSVDCEGFDLPVLQSHDFEKYPTDFIWVEADSRTVPDLLDYPLHAYLDSRGYALISKLSRSALYARKSSPEFSQL